MKKSKITEIIKEKVFSKSEEKLKTLGFSFRQKRYIAEINEKTHTIEIGQGFILFYDERTDVLFLCFDLRFYTFISGYDKWYKENIFEGDCEEGFLQFQFRHFYLKLNHSDYDPEDFHPGSQSVVITDTNVEEKLKDENYSEKFYMPYERVEFNVDKFYEVVSKFIKSNIDYKKLIEENYELLKFKSMPIYLKQNGFENVIT